MMMTEQQQPSGAGPRRSSSSSSSSQQQQQHPSQKKGGGGGVRASSVSKSQQGKRKKPPLPPNVAAAAAAALKRGPPPPLLPPLHNNGYSSEEEEVRYLQQQQQRQSRLSAQQTLIQAQAGEGGELLQEPRGEAPATPAPAVTSLDQEPRSLANTQGGNSNSGSLNNNIPISTPLSVMPVATQPPATRSSSQTTTTTPSQSVTNTSSQQQQLSTSVPPEREILQSSPSPPPPLPLHENGHDESSDSRPPSPPLLEPDDEQSSVSSLSEGGVSRFRGGKEEDYEEEEEEEEEDYEEEEEEEVEEQVVTKQKDDAEQKKVVAESAAVVGEMPSYVPSSKTMTSASAAAVSAAAVAVATTRSDGFNVAAAVDNNDSKREQDKFGDIQLQHGETVADVAVEKHDMETDDGNIKETSVTNNKKETKQRLSSTSSHRHSSSTNQNRRSQQRVAAGAAATAAHADEEVAAADAPAQSSSLHKKRASSTKRHSSSTAKKDRKEQHSSKRSLSNEKAKEKRKKRTSTTTTTTKKIDSKKESSSVRPPKEISARTPSPSKRRHRHHHQGSMGGGSSSHASMSSLAHAAAAGVAGDTSSHSRRGSSQYTTPSGRHSHGSGGGGDNAASSSHHKRRHRHHRHRHTTTNTGGGSSTAHSSSEGVEHIKTCYRSEALEELASNVRDTLCILEGVPNATAITNNDIIASTTIGAGAGGSSNNNNNGGVAMMKPRMKSVRMLVIEEDDPLDVTTTDEEQGEEDEEEEDDYYNDDNSDNNNNEERDYAQDMNPAASEEEEQEQRRRHRRNNSTTRGKRRESSNPASSSLKLCRKIIHAFHDLLGRLLQLSDELELSSTFISTGSRSSSVVVSSNALSAILSHTPIIDLAFGGMKPILMSIHESNGEYLLSVMEDEDVVAMKIALRRILKLVRMITLTAERVCTRQEWNARSETCYVTLLELLQWTSYELQRLEQNGDYVTGGGGGGGGGGYGGGIVEGGDMMGGSGEGEGYAICPALRRAWTASGHTEELMTLQLGLHAQHEGQEEDHEDDKEEEEGNGYNQGGRGRSRKCDGAILLREVCYEVLISTDHWCPDVTDLSFVCDCDDSVLVDWKNGVSTTLIDKAGRNGIKVGSDGNMVLAQSSIFGGKALCDIPAAALGVLRKIRSPEPLPRVATMGRIVRRILPADALSPSMSRDSSQAGVCGSLRSSVWRGSMNSNGLVTAEAGGGTSDVVVAISSVPEDPHDPTALGMGGVGKTTMAAMVASRTDVRSYFKDGIAWLYLGQRLEKDMTYEFYCQCLREICVQLQFLTQSAITLDRMIHTPGERQTTRKRREAKLMTHARDAMCALLEGRKVLIVLDDVTWRKDLHWFRFHAQQEATITSKGRASGARAQSAVVSSKSLPISSSNRGVTILVTTQFRDLLPAADTVEIDLLNEDEAVRLLVTESDQPPDHVMASSLEARAVTRDCANHPLAVRSVGRWLGLKHTTAGVIGSIEEIHEEMTKSVEKLSGNSDINYEIMGLSFSPCVNERPTQVIKLCFAAFVKVFCSEEGLSADPTRPLPAIPMEAADILFERILELEERKLFQDESPFHARRKEAVLLIPEALSALGVIGVFTRTETGGKLEKLGDDLDKFIQIQHDIQQEYGEFLVTPEGGLDELIEDCERTWNAAFVAAFLDTKGDSNWDDEKPDLCRRYALEMLVSHMLRGEMVKEAAALLKDFSFVKGRLQSMGREEGTRRHIHDCEALIKKLKDLEDDEVVLEPDTLMERAYQRIGSLLTTDIGGVDAEERKALSIEAGLAYYEIGFSLAEHRCWNQAVSHWETSQELLVSTLGVVELVAAIRFNVGVLYIEKNEYDKALDSIKQCLQIRKVVHGENHMLYAQTVQKLGDIYLSMSDYPEAMESYDKALEVFNKEPSNNRIDIGNILQCIGFIYYSRGALDEAMRRFDDALHCMKMELGENHPDLAIIVQRLGSCFADLGKIIVAIPHFEEAIRLKRLDPSGGEENEADILCIEGMVLNLRGEQDEGLRCYQRAFKILKTNIPHKREKIANLLHLIGCVYLVRNQHKKAMKRFEESLQTRRRMLGFVHLDVSSTLINMAYIYQTKQKFDKALKCLEEALRIRKLRLPESDKLAVVYEKIGSLHVMIGEFKKAELAFEEALKIRKIRHGDDHESVASVLHEMGDLMDKIGEYEEAMSCFTDALDIRRRNLGTNHEDVAATLYSMGFTLHNQGIYDRALLYFQEALDIRKARLGEDASEVGETLNIIGFLLAKTGKLDDALSALMEALRIRKLIGDDVKASDTLKNLGNVHREKQENELALENYQECLRIRRAQLGDDHEKVSDALIAVGNIKSDMDNLESAMSSYQEALTIRIMVYGAHDQKVAALLQTMGMVEFRKGDLARAKQYLEEYIRIRDVNKSQQDSDYVNVLFTIGNIYKIQGDGEEAQRRWAEAYEIFNRLGLAAENPKIAQVMDNLLKKDKKAKDPRASSKGGSVFSFSSKELSTGEGSSERPQM